MNKDNIKDLNSLLTEAEVEAKLNSLIKSLEEELEAEGTEDKEPEEIDATKLEVEPVGTEDEKKAEDVAETVNEDVVAEDTLEIDPVTTKAEAEGAEDKVAEPIAPAAEETEAPVKTEVEVEVSRAEDAVEPESPIADAEIERPAIEIDPLKVVEEQLENIFAILRESESDEAVKDGHQEIEDVAKKEVKVNDSDIKKDTAEDVNDNKGEAHEVKVEADATEDKVEEKEDAGEKVADEVAKEIEAGIVKEELEAEGTEDREPKEVEASEVEVEPAGTDEGKEVEDVAETVNEEADLTLEEMVEIISMLSDDALLEFLSDLNGSEYNILSENIELSESLWDWTKRRAREIRDIHRFNNPLGLKKTIKKVNRMDAKAKIQKLKGSKEYKEASRFKKYDDNGNRVKTKKELRDEIYNKQKQNDKDMIAAAKKTAEENRTNAAKNDFEIKKRAAQAKLNKLNSKYKLNKNNNTTQEYKSDLNDKNLTNGTLAKEYEEKTEEKTVETNSSFKYSDLDLMNILAENDYEATVENLLVLKEGLSSGEYVIEELEAEGTEDREPKEVEASEVEVEPAGTEDEKKAEDVAETVNEEAEVVTPDVKEGTEESKEETESELSREEVMGKEEVVDDAKSETVHEEVKFTTLKEAFQLGSSYFCTPDRIQDLQEKVALLVAKENDDLLFQEMVKCTQLAESFKNRLLNKYSIISENRTSEFLQLMQESEACMDAVENREPKEVEASAVEVSPAGSEDEIIKTDVEPEVNDEKKKQIN